MSQYLLPPLETHTQKKSKKPAVAAAGALTGKRKAQQSMGAAPASKHNRSPAALDSRSEAVGADATSGVRQAGRKQKRKHRAPEDAPAAAAAAAAAAL